MDPKNTKIPPITLRRFPDLRTESSSDEAQLVHRLLKNWPCVPGRESSAAASALDCAAILLRSIYARARADCMPKPSDAEGAFTQYAWSLFDEQGQPIYDQRLRQHRNAALAVIRPGLNGHSRLSFADICKSDAMVEALWKHPRFHLTHPWIIKGPKYPREGSVCRNHEQVSRDFLRWDGANPESVEQLVSKVTTTKRSGEDTKLVFFKSPDVIQVDLTAGEGPGCRLVDQWRFQAWSMVPDPSDDENGMSSVNKGRKISYIVRAIVRHAAGDRNADSIRVFREDGAEQLPEGLAVNNPMPDWGFRLGDAVPLGEKLSIFYAYYPDIEHLPPTKECSENLQVPKSLRDPILSGFKAFKPAENPAAHRDPSAKDQEYMHPDRLQMIENQKGAAQGTAQDQTSGGGWQDGEHFSRPPRRGSRRGKRH